MATRVIHWGRALVALGSGVASVVLFRRGLAFAPVAAASIVLAWMLASMLGRSTPKAGAGRLRRLVHFAGSWLVASLHQDALFFLLPVWFGSATWPSVNVAFPALLAVLAVLSCIGSVHERYVLHHPAVRSVVSAICLFAALLPAAGVLLHTPLLPTVMGSAALASLLAVLALLPERTRTRGRGIAAAIGATLLASVILAAAAPLLPPVPVQCLSIVTATEVVEKEPVGVADSFDAGVPRVYAHVSIVAPQGFSSTLRFDWSREGEAMQRSFETSIVGGRKSGFRTWASLTNPRGGRWHVEVYAESGQLVTRRTFEVAR